MSSKHRPTLTVLAGVNGAGKSSVGGQALRDSGAAYSNPDEHARRLRANQPTLPLQKANAIATGTDFTFESTLGGKTITRLLIQAVQKTLQLDIWFVGLESVDLHLTRVAQRVAHKGGHPIPATDIRNRWIGSHENNIRLIPYVNTLRVFDNTVDVPAGVSPEPSLLMSIDDGTLTYPAPDQMRDTPAWAKPIIITAYKHFGHVK